MTQIDEILDFAEIIAKEDNAKMEKLQDWCDFIEPLFNNKFPYKWDLSLSSLYNDECQKWMDVKRIEFNNKI